MNILKEDIDLICQEASEALAVFNQENAPEKKLEEARQKITAFLPHLDHLIYSYPLNRFPYCLYRVRQEQAIPGDEFIQEVGTFSYPAPEKCHVARANKEGCPVFYVADSVKTALKEVDCKTGQIVFLSEWTLINPREARFFLFFGKPLPEKSFWRKAQTDQQALLQQRLQHLPEKNRKQWLDLYNIYYEAFMGEDYEVSSIIGHYLLYESDPAGIQLLVYPSKADEETSFNLAIHPDFVDTNLQLKRVFRLLVTDEEAQLTTNTLSVGDMQNGAVNWRIPSESEQQLIKK